MKKKERVVLRPKEQPCMFCGDRVDTSRWHWRSKHRAACVGLMAAVKSKGRRPCTALTTV